MSLISSNLVFLRKKQGLRQKELALDVGLKSTAYSNYETGTSLPDVHVLLKISKYFGVLLDDLLTKDLSKGLDYSNFGIEPVAQYTKEADQKIIELQQKVITLMEEVAELKLKLPVTDAPIVSTTRAKNAS